MNYARYLLTTEPTSLANTSTALSVVSPNMEPPGFSWKTDMYQDYTIDPYQLKDRLGSSDCHEFWLFLYKRWFLEPACSKKEFLSKTHEERYEMKGSACEKIAVLVISFLILNGTFEPIGEYERYPPIHILPDGYPRTIEFDGERKPVEKLVNYCGGNIRKFARRNADFAYAVLNLPENEALRAAVANKRKNLGKPVAKFPEYDFDFADACDRMPKRARRWVREYFGNYPKKDVYGEPETVMSIFEKEDSETNSTEDEGNDELAEDCDLEDLKFPVWKLEYNWFTHRFDYV